MVRPHRLRRRNPLSRLPGPTRVCILPHCIDPPTSSIHPGCVAGQLTVNLCNMKLVKATSHQRAWSRNSCVCCSQLCGTRAVVLYQVTDLCAFHAPLFLISTNLRTLRALSDEALECQVKYDTSWIFEI